ncbi:GNAT family N-acetyltransferase [Azospirillum halopraeferens]|uniref:GNAT family N-acetyltransferase n=1 Tax=Azospirillum halopraeferens TaxID=34010 RepID=UPI00040A59D5|nr:GNAT family N-acetyltransferase [Azospirillum halopraeferens]
MGQGTIVIEPARTDAEIDAAFPVIQQLRSHMTDAVAFREQIRRQMDDGYTLALLRFDGEVAGCAGFRVHETLSRGTYMYVEDLVTNSALRSHGLGDALFDWLVNEAKERGCGQMEVISGTQRTDAHRFYHRKRMVIKSFQLVLTLK